MSLPAAEAVRVGCPECGEPVGRECRADVDGVVLAVCEGDQDVTVCLARYVRLARECAVEN